LLKIEKGKKKEKKKTTPIVVIYFFSSKRKKKNHRKKKNVKKGGSLPIFSCFCVWNEVFLLPSPFHVPLSFPPSSNVVSCISLSFELLKLGSPLELWQWSE
jgi:hypothetical protein